jgi:hypothetical protein
MPMIRRVIRPLLPFLVLTIIVVVVTQVVSSAREASEGGSIVEPAATTDHTATADTLPRLPVADSMFGRSRHLLFRTLDRAEALALPGFLDLYGEQAIRTPAVHRVAVPGLDSGFAYVVMRGFGEKRGDELNGYKLGRWPSEKWMMARNYWNPDGFIEVTPENVGLRLSTHFTLRDFLTHDQQDVWPKYVVLREDVIDKLELVLADLAEKGIPSGRVRVLSGFRSPQYNDRVGEGAARASRHQYGDAADVIIDVNGDGRMDDLDGDGRVDLRDTEPILRAVERVEQRHPELTGGTGLYSAMGPSGPFAHIDVRGTVARWDNLRKQ